MRIVRNREGFLVDEETGVVIEDSNIDYEHPEYRIFSYEDYLRKSHYSPLSSNILNPNGRVDEGIALEALGIKGLVVYRCLVCAGMSSNSVIDAIRRVGRGAKGYGRVFRLVKVLSNSVDRGVRESLIRWNARVLGNLDLKYASVKLKAPIKYGKVPQVIAEVGRFKVQLTRSKVDIASRMYEYEDVRETVLKLRKLLGVELSEPLPKVATVVIELPFEVSLGIILKMRRTVQQGFRVKMWGDFWVALIFRSKVNMYVRLKDNLSKIELALLECLPKVCSAARI